VSELSRDEGERWPARFVSSWGGENAAAYRLVGVCLGTDGVLADACMERIVAGKQLGVDTKEGGGSRFWMDGWDQASTFWAILVGIGIKVYIYIDIYMYHLGPLVPGTDRRFSIPPTFVDPSSL
jgi:hypothetical protein